MNAVILTIGDELLIGQVTNTNAAWLGERLTATGVHVLEMLTVSDTEDSIREAVERCLQHADLIITTGGLGPTHDDVTKTVVAEYFGLELVFRQDLYDEIVRRFELRDIPIAKTNRDQAMVPAGFDVLTNPIGTAPGLEYRLTMEQKDKRLILLPGVPREMKAIVSESVLPSLEASDRTRVIVQRTVLTTGIAESNLNELLSDLDRFLNEEATVAFLPGLAGVRLRISAYGNTSDSATNRANEIKAYITDKAATFVYGEGDQTMEEIVGKMLADRGLTIACAESCTGGLVSSRLTDVPGSSGYVVGGVVAYDDSIKEDVLDVEAELLNMHGAVSRQVVCQMAIGVREKFGASIGIATSGIMGPTGGTEEKPVGTVWIGYSDENGESAALLKLTNERIRNKERTVTAILNMVRLKLLRSSGA